MDTYFHKPETKMVKKYLIWPIRLFLYVIAILIISFYSFCLFLTTDFGSKQTSKLLFGENIKFEDISIEPSLLGMRVDIQGFSFLGAANFSGDRINLEINFLNSLIGKVIYIPSLELYNSEVKLNDESSTDEAIQPDIYINELSITNLKAGNIEFKRLELNNFLSQAAEIGFAFNDLSIDLPGSINSLDQFNGRGYFSENKLFLNVDSNEVLIDFTFYDAPSEFKNLKGYIEIDLNNDFSIPFAKLSASDGIKNIKSSFKYDDSFLLELWVKGNQSDVINLIPSTADNVKLFLENSNFETSNLDLLLSFTDFGNDSNFNVVMKAQDGSLKVSGLDLATKSTNFYIDNSSLRIFGDGLKLTDLDLGKVFLSRKLMDDANYKLVLNDYDNFTVQFNDEGILKSIDGKIPTLDSDLNVSFNKNRILLNADEIYFDFNILDNYETINGGFKIYPSGFNSNYFSLDNTQKSSFEFNFNDISDTFLTLSAISPLLSDAITIKGIAHTRMQETDRILAMTNELRKLGQQVNETTDSIHIIPDFIKLKKAAQDIVEIDTYEDHRVAMSFAILGSFDLFNNGKPWMRIKNPNCCSKTFPNFFETLSSIRTQSIGI